MVVLVTGATGHLGNVLVRKLLEQGHSVRALVRRINAPALEGLDVEQFEGDLFDRETIDRASAGTQRIFHSAAFISTLDRDAAKVERVNLLGTRVMIEAALAAGVERFVYVSSVEALDLRSRSEPVADFEFDFDPSTCIMAYGRSKALATREVLAAVHERGLPAVIGIPSGLMGPFDFGSSRTAEMVRRYLARRIPGYIEGGFDFVDVRDVADGLIAAADRGRVGESYLLTGELRSYYEITETLEAISGVPMSHLKVPNWLAFPFTYLASAFAVLFGREPLYTPNSLRILQTWPRFDLEKSRSELDYRPRSMEEALADTVAWVQGKFAEVKEGTE